MNKFILYAVASMAFYLFVAWLEYDFFWITWNPEDVIWRVMVVFYIVVQLCIAAPIFATNEKEE